MILADHIVQRNIGLGLVFGAFLRVLKLPKKRLLVFGPLLLKIGRRSNLASKLQDEIDDRVEWMAITGDIPEEDREYQALADIVSLSAEEHGAYTRSEIRAWNRIRKAAKFHLELQRLKEV